MAETKIVFDAAADYERFMGRWSRAIGEQFLTWLDPPADARWLDLGCGTGAFSELILRRCTPKSVTGIDPSPAQIEYVRKLLPGHTFEVGDSMAMPFGDGAFDIVASALVSSFISFRIAPRPSPKCTACCGPAGSSRATPGSAPQPPTSRLMRR